MNKAELKKDLIALCAKHKVTLYADEDEPCTVIEDTPEEGHDITPHFVKMVTEENFWEY